MYLGKWCSFPKTKVAPNPILFIITQLNCNLCTPWTPQRWLGLKCWWRRWRPDGPFRMRTFSKGPGLARSGPVWMAATFLLQYLAFAVVSTMATPKKDRVSKIAINLDSCEWSSKNCRWQKTPYLHFPPIMLIFELGPGYPSIQQLLCIPWHPHHPQDHMGVSNPWGIPKMLGLI